MGRPKLQTQLNKKLSLADKAIERMKSVEDTVHEFLKNESAVQRLDDAVSKYPQLSPREQEFAQRYALECRPKSDWSRIFGVSHHTISRWLEREDLRSLINQIRYDFRLYMLSKQMLLMKIATDVQLEILQLKSLDADTIEVKRKTAKDVMDFIKDIKTKDRTPEEWMKGFVKMAAGSDGKFSAIKEKTPLSSDDSVDIKELENRLQELEAIEAALDEVSKIPSTEEVKDG